MPDKFYMITAVKEGQTSANVYEDYSKFKQDFFNLQEKLQIKAYLLTPTEEEPDIVIARLENNTLIACLGPKQELKGDKFIKCTMQEIKPKS